MLARQEGFITKSPGQATLESYGSARLRYEKRLLAHDQGRRSSAILAKGRFFLPNYQCSMTYGRGTNSKVLADQGYDQYYNSVS